MLGPWACASCKFATIELVCFLTFLLCDFKIEPLLWMGEMKEQWEDQILVAEIALTLSVVDVLIDLLEGWENEHCSSSSSFS